MPRAVLIAPLLGYRKEAEWERLERTIHASDATRVRLLTMPEGEDTKPEVREHAREKLAALAATWPRFEWDERHVNLMSFEASLAAFAELFAEERGNDVAVSLGTGGAAGAVASTVACLLWGGRGIYASSPGYKSLPVEELPEWLKVGPPLVDDELRVLRLVVDEPDGLDKKTILAKLKAMGRIRQDQDKHAYRRLSAELLPKLESQGFVTVGPRDAWDRRRHFVTATEEGQRAYRVLVPMLKEPTATLHVRGARKPAAPKRARL